VPRRILIVTHSADLHADLVAERIAARDAPAFRLNLDRFPVDYELDLHFRSPTWTGHLRHLPSGDTLAVADIGAVWTRKTAEFTFSNPEMGTQERAFAVEETQHALSGLLYGLQDVYWMSHPLAVRGAQWKGEQLARAARLGFDVPDTLITASAASARAFHAGAGGEIVYKTMASASLGAEHVRPEERVSGGIGTTRIGAEHAALLDGVAETPCQFQHLVAKRHELRVTVIGDRVFAARIHSQDDPRTQLDFRDFSAPIRYEAEALSPELEARCREFVHGYGLQYGAIDLIVTPDGRHVFLENNPGGQFLFVEQLVPELRMLDAVADRLIAGAHGRR
jgi:glutathione synthase/RimK-type ligase-like ATP-grasp enzyme